MADNEMQRRPQDRQYTWLWMILAVVLVAALMVWLAVESEPTPSVAVVEEEDGAAPGPMVPATPIDQFAANPIEYAGQTVRLTDLEVASRMGTQAMWVNLPGDIPYLIKLDSTALGAQAATLGVGDVVTVSGTVYPMTDSVLSAWQAAGAIENEGQLAEAQFATSFIEATRAQRTRGARPPGTSPTPSP